ncbi:MAG: hypothetical protein R3E39_05385 [Anaerolineae bacterium]
MDKFIRKLTIERTAAIIIFLLLFAMATRIPVDTDIWWHLRAGQYTLSNGMIYADAFSYTKAGMEWVNHSWGAQVILFGVWQVAGNFGLAVYTAVLATGGMWFIYRMSAGSVYLRAFALVVGAATAAVFWSPRPQMLSFFLSTVILYLLHLHKREKKDYLWWIPPIMCIWGNIHAGFSIGFIFLCGSIVGEILGNIFSSKSESVVPPNGIRKLVMITLVSLIALVINPYGLQMLAVPFQTVGIGALQNFIQEWNSPNFHERQTWPFVILLLGNLGVIGASKKRLDWTDFVLSAGTAFMGLLAGRNIAVFAVVATPVLTRHLDDIFTERGWVVNSIKRVTPLMGRLNAVLVVIIAVVTLGKMLLVLDTKSIAEAQEEYLPVKVTEFLSKNPPNGSMFNSYNWGGYFIYWLPNNPVFVDGRTDLYGDDFLSNDYLKTATGAPGWQETLNRFSVNVVVIEDDSGLARSLRSERGWRLDYEDKQAVVFTRETAKNE